jgi:hypothetical protein
MKIRNAQDYHNALDMLRSAELAMQDGIRFTCQDLREVLAVSDAVAKYEQRNQNNRDYVGRK